MDVIVNRRGTLGAEHGYRLLDLLSLSGWDIAVIKADPKDVFGGVGVEIRAYRNDLEEPLVERGLNVRDGSALRLFQRAVRL